MSFLSRRGFLKAGVVGTCVIIADRLPAMSMAVPLTSSNTVTRPAVEWGGIEAVELEPFIGEVFRLSNETTVSRIRLIEVLIQPDPNRPGFLSRKQAFTAIFEPLDSVGEVDFDQMNNLSHSEISQADVFVNKYPGDADKVFLAAVFG